MKKEFATRDIPLQGAVAMSGQVVVDEDEPLYDIDDPPFEPRDVQVRNDKWVTAEFDILDFLGRGKFGEVKRCQELSSGHEFAAKFICAPRPQDKRDVEHEIDIMKRLQHRRLIQLYDAFESKTEMCLVLEIIYGGELFDRVISEDFILTERACVCFVRQICEGLAYMHGSSIIHLDMKPENILCLTRMGNRIKIIDFGLARVFDPRKDLRVLFGTPEFMAPEVVNYEPITYATDMWSVGVICYVLLSGLSPFMGDTDGDTLTNVIKGLYDFDYAEFDDVSASAKDLISNLLTKEKKHRLTAEQCLQHEWLQLQKPEDVEPKSPSLNLSKKRLKRFVYRRKWQKIVHAIIALKRMGVQLNSIAKPAVNCQVPVPIDEINDKLDGLPSKTKVSKGASDKNKNPKKETPQLKSRVAGSESPKSSKGKSGGGRGGGGGGGGDLQSNSDARVDKVNEVERQESQTSVQDMSVTSEGCDSGIESEQLNDKVEEDQRLSGEMDANVVALGAAKAPPSECNDKKDTKGKKGKKSSNEPEVKAACSKDKSGSPSEPSKNKDIRGKLVFFKERPTFGIVLKKFSKAGGGGGGASDKNDKTTHPKQGKRWEKNKEKNTGKKQVEGESEEQAQDGEHYLEMKGTVRNRMKLFER